MKVRSAGATFDPAKMLAQSLAMMVRQVAIIIAFKVFFVNPDPNFGPIVIASRQE
jgi:hypothetical protein